MYLETKLLVHINLELFYLPSRWRLPDDASSFVLSSKGSCLKVYFIWCLKLLCLLFLMCVYTLYPFPTFQLYLFCVLRLANGTELGLAFYLRLSLLHWRFSLGRCISGFTVFLGVVFFVFICLGLCFLNLWLDICGSISFIQFFKWSVVTSSNIASTSFFIPSLLGTPATRMLELFFTSNMSLLWSCLYFPCFSLCVHQSVNFSLDLSTESLILSSSVPNLLLNWPI